MAKIVKGKKKKEEKWEKLQRLYTFIHNDVTRTSIRIKRTTFPDKVTLESIALFEKRSWKAKELQKKDFTEKWRPAWDAIVKAGGQAHCKVTHKFTGGGDPWWLYKQVDDTGISHDWVKEPEKPINLELGQRFYEASQYTDYTMGIRWSLFRSILNKLIERYLWDKENLPERAGVTLRLLINGRSYWYYSAYNKSSIPMWQRLSWPEDEMKTVEAKA